ncbi:MAG: DUF2786 domain-containing protein [Granulosicoccus sp.]
MDTRQSNKRTDNREQHDGHQGPGQVSSEADNREKLLNRIRKLYAMSRESDSSPHEAEIAMRRCQSLMSRFGITESDLETSEFGASKIDKAFRSIPGYVGVLGSAVALLHDCICVRSNTIEFRGFSIDADVASLTYAYLSEAMERSLKDHKRRGSVEPGRSASFDYRVGYALAVLQRARQLDAERRSQEEQAAAAAGQERAGPGSSLVIRKREVVRNACMEGLVTRRATRVRYRNGRAHEAGTSDGSRVSLDKQMGNVKRKAVKG